MMRIFILFVAAIFFGLVVFAQNYDSNIFNQDSNFCTGGACSIDTMKQNNFMHNDATHTNFQQNNAQNYYDNGHNRGGLNNSGSFTYDFNCQFGNCLPRPTGSYQP